MLTDVGRVVQGYAEDIFSRGREMLDVVKQRGGPAGLTLAVGVSDALPKLVAWRLLQPALSLGREVRVVCRDGRHDRLLAELALHELDVVLSDAPAAGGLHVRAFNHLLGRMRGVLLRRAGARWPAEGPVPARPRQGAVCGAGGRNGLRHSLDAWFERHGVRPRIVGEIEDSALLKTFGQAGAGVFAAPSVIEREVTRQHQVRVIGRTRRHPRAVLRHLGGSAPQAPAVVAMTEAARGTLASAARPPR